LTKTINIRHGGKRPGAGRKSAEETGVPRMTKHTLTMTAEDADQLRELGGGYLSRGVREALRRLNEYAAR